MTPEQQRIAIAKAHGRVQRPDGSWFPIGKDYGSAGIHNYLFDLNAMHEAEKVLGACWPTYCEHLLEIVEPEPRTLEICHRWNLLHATASQRAEAFLRTIGKWEEAK